MTDPVEPLDWRAVLALLANAETRSAFAEVAASAPLASQARRRALARLTMAGVLELDPEGRPRVAEERLRATLRASAEPPPAGAERFLSRDGFILDYPSRVADRKALLELVVSRAVHPGESLTERQLGERLAEFTIDAATLRRYLVDSGLLSRLGDGTGYRRSE